MMRRLLLFFCVVGLAMVLAPGCGPKKAVVPPERAALRETEPTLEEELEIARAYYDRGRVGDAAEHYRSVIERDSTSFEANLYLGLSLLTMEDAKFTNERDFAVARKYLERASKLRSSDPRPFFYLGKLDFEDADYSSAVRNLEQAIQIEPSNGEAHAMLGIALDELGMHDRARNELYKAVGIDPDNELANLRLGILLEAQGDDEKAAGYLEQALKVNPNNDRALYILERVYYDNHLFQRAEDACRRFLRYHPGDVQSLEILGWIYRKQGRDEKMVATYRELVKVKPENTSYWSVLIKYFMDRARYQSAAETIRQSLQHNPYYAYGNLQYAQILMREGNELYHRGKSEEALARYVEAKEYLEKARFDSRYEGIALSLIDQISKRISQVRQ